MENKAAIQQTEVSEFQRLTQTSQTVRSIPWIDEAEDVLQILRKEGGDNLFNYVEWLRLLDRTDLIVLSSRHHYFYNNEEMENVRTVVNLKLLNQVRNLELLIDTIYKLIKPAAFFVGSFAEEGNRYNGKVNISFGVNGNTSKEEAIEHGIISRIPILNHIYNFFDSRTNRYMTRQEVITIFSLHGFDIVDMTEMNGLVYFCAKKSQLPGNDS